MSSKAPLGLGMIGCGAFGRFCLDAFAELDCVRLAAVADERPDAARACAEAHEAAAATPAELVTRDDVDLVHIATPPSSHRDLAVAALRAGKHVLCEKPLAMDLSEADEILAAAEQAGRICPVNFVLRHNELVDAVSDLLAAGPLGKPLAARLTNCAFDTYMPPEHWFWDAGVSGGIFVEHGVHFFDMYRQWLGPGEVVNAHTETRDGRMEDRVTCTVRHTPADGPPVLVSHYHGFDQIEPMDRAEHRIVCEMGDIRLHGWVPLSLAVDAAVDDEGAERLRACRAWTTAEVVEQFGDGRTDYRGRGVPRRVTQRLRLSYTPEPDKAKVYSDGLRALLVDQATYIAEPSHPRRVTERDGRDALAIAASAREMAQ